MNLHGIEIPNQILNAIRDNKLVVFAGAGASMGAPTSLPSFKSLIKEFSRGTFAGISASETKSEDQYLGELESENILVHKKIAEKFDSNKLEPNSYHRALVNLFGRRNKLRIITTNYDTMFEKVCEEVGYKTRVYTNPALPYGDDFEGIIHIHGIVDDPKNIVITDKDFGKVYMYHSNISKFLLDLFNSDYVILFVGYSYNDLIMRYFTRAIGDMALDRRFIFIEENLVDTVSMLGITPITYPDNCHEIPYLALEQVVDFVNRDALSWERRISEIANINPSFIDKRTEDELAHIVKDIHLLDKFLKNVNSLGWLIYFNYKGYIKNLFSDGKFSDFEYIFGKWLIENFLKEDFEEFKYLCVKNNFSLNLQFQKMIIDELSSICDEKMSEILSFIEIEKMDKVLLLEIFDRIKDTSLEQYRYRIVKTLFKFKYEFRKLANFLEENEKNKDIEIRAYTILSKDEMQDIWLKSNFSNDFSRRLNRYMIDQVLDLYAKKDLGKVDKNFANYMIFTDKKFVNAIDVFVWIISEILKSEFDSFKPWIRDNIKSDFEIIRRIAAAVIVKQNDCDLTSLVFSNTEILSDLEKIEFNNLLGLNGSMAVCSFDIDSSDIDNSLGTRYQKDDLKFELVNIENLVNYKDINGNRDSLLKDISELCSENYDFFLELANALIVNRHEDSDIWTFALKGLGSNEEIFEKLEKVIELLDKDSLIEAQTYSISLFIKRFVENFDIDNSKRANSLIDILMRLWKYGENFGSKDSSAWNEMTFRSSFGVIANTILRIVQKTSEDKGRLSDEDKELIEKLLENENAFDAKFVIIGNFSFFYALDKKWAVDKLSSYFESSNLKEFRIAWRGFLTFSRMYPEIALLMKGRFDYAISRLDDIEEKGKFRDKFVRSYTFLMLNTKSDPIDSYIPKIFMLSDLDIQSFYSELNSNVAIMSKDAKEDICKSWVLEFILNRGNNIPKKIGKFEIPSLLKLILNSGANIDAWAKIPRIKSADFSFVNEFDFESNIENHSKQILNVFTYITNILVLDRTSTPNWSVLKTIESVTKRAKSYAEIPSDLQYNFKIFDINL